MTATRQDPSKPSHPPRSRFRLKQPWHVGGLAIVAAFCLERATPLAAADLAPTSRPNIVFILTDDMGYGDPGCYGGKFAPTPNMDRLAREGIRFTRFYTASPICSPSRTGFTTGMYPARWRITSYLQTRKGNRACEQADFLDPKAPSLARTLRAAGYATGHFGKWHMGGGRDVTNAPPFSAYGFDEHASTWESPDPHPDITATNWIWSQHDKVKRWDRSAFFVDKALDFLNRHRDQPCYVNIWPDEVHTPWVPSEERLREYPNGPEEERKFSAVLDEYDRQLGRFMTGLKELGLDAKTLVIFSSDNGALPTFHGTRSGGLRGSKLSLYEGGIRMPFLVRWPGHAPAGRTDDQTLMGAVDLFPSLCALAGAPLPQDAALDGVDLSAAFSGKPAANRARPLFWEYGRNDHAFAYPKGADRSPNVAVRDGNWKLLVNADGTQRELYNIAADPNETANLADKEQATAESLSTQALKWQKSLPGPAPVSAAASRPDILLIMSDDMGFSDLGCYGSEIATPNLDALAKNGLRFTQFYNTARCCPTRASLLTGLYPHQAGMGHMTGHGSGRDDGYAGDLNQRCVTIAEALRPAGYRTYVCGKWHVCDAIAPDGPKHNWPLQRGFDRFYGTVTGAGSFYDPTTLCRDNTYITPANDPEYKPARFYYTDAISDNAITFIRDHAQSQPSEPFFMYVAYTAAHWPMHAPPEDIAKYRGKYDAGYGPVRAARFARLKELGLIDRAWELSPQAEDWATVTNKAWETRCMEVYAAMVDRLDQGIGRIVAELKRQNRLDNTLIFFLQDNGGCAEPMGRKSNADEVRNMVCKPMAPDELQKQIWPPMQTRDGRPVRTGPDVMPGPEDTYVGYGRGWANVSNTPFREYKHWVHEGGIATPLIVHWPKAIPETLRNQLVAEPAHLVDLMSTCVDVGGATYPAEKGGQKIQPMEGVSLRPAFAGESIARAQPICWEHESNRAIRDGQWKLVAKANQPWELYDMSADRTEMYNLAAQRPGKARNLAAQWRAWAARANVLPLGSWRGQPPDKKPAKQKKS
ncbi:MAG TPA: sulfatase-like hydrolase/transferase [Candidatus Paceibacterota bacterium]|nr:sulfatase-like hydrolase/transferase [Verrucomicrobiota bacterium]HSA12653.1 sulfatase-like hydrolase/transferase [Candidatus Paceibacterota bacterium]